MNSATMCFHRTGAPLTLGEVISSFVVVHEDHAGFVIGHNGATVKHIGSKTNTWIHVQPPNEFSMGHPWFVIKGGTQDDVAAAYHQMRMVLQDAEMKMPRWSVGLTMTSEDYDHYEAYLSEPIQKAERLLNQMDECYEFDAALTDFAFKDTETWALNEEITFFESMSKCELYAFYETHLVDYAKHLGMSWLLKTDVGPSPSKLEIEERIAMTQHVVNAYLDDDFENDIYELDYPGCRCDDDPPLTDFEKKIYNKDYNILSKNFMIVGFC